MKDLEGKKVVVVRCNGFTHGDDFVACVCDLIGEEVTIGELGDFGYSIEGHDKIITPIEFN